MDERQKHMIVGADLRRPGVSDTPPELFRANVYSPPNIAPKMGWFLRAANLECPANQDPLFWHSLSRLAALRLIHGVKLDQLALSSESEGVSRALLTRGLIFYLKTVFDQSPPIPNVSWSDIGRFDQRDEDLRPTYREWFRGLMDSLDDPLIDREDRSIIAQLLPLTAIEASDAFCSLAHGVETAKVSCGPRQYEAITPKLTGDNVDVVVKKGVQSMSYHYWKVQEAEVVASLQRHCKSAVDARGSSPRGATVSKDFVATADEVGAFLDGFKISAPRLFRTSMDLGLRPYGREKREDINRDIWGYLHGGAELTPILARVFLAVYNGSSRDMRDANRGLGSYLRRKSVE